MSALVSVIMPAYNAELHIFEAVHSVLNQTHSNLELIVLDDGSTDNTLKILQSINDSRLILHKNKENQGIVKTLNKAVMLSSGLYIARMDADDVSSPDRLEKQLKFLLENDLDIVSAVVRKFNDNYSRNFPFEMNSKEIIYALAYFNPIVHPCAFGYSEIFKKFPYKEEFKWAEDYKLWCDLSVAQFKFGIQKDVLLNYRLHPSQVSVKNKKIQLVLDAKIKREYQSSRILNINNVSMKVWFYCQLKRLQIYLKKF